MNRIRLCLAALLTTFPMILGAQSYAQEKAAKGKDSAQEQAQVLLALHQQHQNAVTMSAQGRLREAEAELRQIVSTCRKVFGKDHPDTLISRSNLAATLAEEGKEAAVAQACKEVEAAMREELHAVREAAKRTEKELRYQVSAAECR
jgi:multidrug efflux pump subunit AcrB